MEYNAHMAINTEWHKKNKMPKNALLSEEVEWHKKHAQYCGCRPVPSLIGTIQRPSFKIFSNEDFEETLLLIEVLYDYFSKHTIPGYSTEPWVENINGIVAYALNQPSSIGVSWRNGKFYPEGAEEFDEKLISDALKWLESKPKIQALYKNALDHYSQSLAEPIKRKDVVSNAFQAVEKLTQEFLSSPRPSFDNNFNDSFDEVKYR